MYTQYFTAEETPTTWAVLAEDYADIGDVYPIEGSTRVVSGNLTLLEATDLAVSKQRASYSENRRASHGA